MIQEPTLTALLTVIRTHKEVRKSFIVRSSEIASSIYSFMNNPDCDCKKKIVQWVYDNEALAKEIIEEHKAIIDPLIPKEVEEPAKVVELTPQEPVISNEPQQSDFTLKGHQVNIRMGDVFEINPDPSEYKKFINKTLEEGWVYRGISVTPVQKDGKDIWLLFLF